MYYMVLLIVNELDICSNVLVAWDAANAPGITILESTGLGRIRKASLRDDLPIMPGLSDLFRSREHRHRTLFSVVEGEEMVDRLIEISQDILGDLNEPDTGVLFVLPVSKAIGLRRMTKQSPESDPSS